MLFQQIELHLLNKKMIDLFLLWFFIFDDFPKMKKIDDFKRFRSKKWTKNKFSVFLLFTSPRRKKCNQFFAFPFERRLRSYPKRGCRRNFAKVFSSRRKRPTRNDLRITVKIKKRLENRLKNSKNGLTRVTSWT